MLEDAKDSAAASAAAGESGRQETEESADGPLVTGRNPLHIRAVPRIARRALATVGRQRGEEASLNDE